MVQERRNIRILAISVLVLCTALVCLSGCTSQQAAAKTGDTVKVNYSVSFPGGSPFESTKDKQPIEFVIGSGEVVKGFDNAVIGMIPGQTKSVTVPPEEGYGPYRPELVKIMDTKATNRTFSELQRQGNITPIYFPGIGMIYQWIDEGNKIGFLRFSNITNETTTVDENSPLAGKTVVYEITLVEIVK